MLMIIVRIPAKGGSASGGKYQKSTLR